MSKKIYLSPLFLFSLAAFADQGTGITVKLHEVCNQNQTYAAPEKKLEEKKLEILKLSNEGLVEKVIENQKKKNEKEVESTPVENPALIVGLSGKDGGHSKKTETIPLAPHDCVNLKGATFFRFHLVIETVREGVGFGKTHQPGKVHLAVYEKKFYWHDGENGIVIGYQSHLAKMNECAQKKNQCVALESLGDGKEHFYEVQNGNLKATVSLTATGQESI